MVLLFEKHCDKAHLRGETERFLTNERRVCLNTEVYWSRAAGGQENRSISVFISWKAKVRKLKMCWWCLCAAGWRLVPDKVATVISYLYWGHMSALWVSVGVVPAAALPCCSCLCVGRCTERAGRKASPVAPPLRHPSSPRLSSGAPGKQKPVWGGACRGPWGPRPLLYSLLAAGVGEGMLCDFLFVSGLKAALQPLVLQTEDVSRRLPTVRREQIPSCSASWRLAESRRRRWRASSSS